MAFEHKINAGSLFKNKRKERDTHADYTGELNVEGKVYWLNAWLNETKSGEKYMAVRLKPKEEKQQQKLKVVGGSDVPDPNDSIPF